MLTKSAYPSCFAFRARLTQPPFHGNNLCLCAISAVSF
jgi:hypothetical protein